MQSFLQHDFPKFKKNNPLLFDPCEMLIVKHRGEDLWKTTQRTQNGV